MSRPLPLCCLLLLIMLAGCKSGEKPNIVRPVKAIKIGDFSGATRRWFPGTAKPVQEATLSFRVSGQLIEYPLNVGDKVDKDDLVARLDPKDFQVALNSAKANLAAAEAQLQAMRVGARPEEIVQLKAAVKRAEADLARATNDVVRGRRLREQGSISRQELDRRETVKLRAEADLQKAKEDLRIGEKGARDEDIAAKEAEIESLDAAVDAAQDRLNYTTLAAPFTGEVVATYVENFETAQAGTRIIRIVNLDQIEMEVSVPETLISAVVYAKKGIAKFDALPGVEIPCTVKEIGREASVTTRTFPLTLIMDQPQEGRILPGMTGMVRAAEELLGEAEVAQLLVPTRAIFALPDGKYVWVVDEQSKKVDKRKVEIGDVTKRGTRVSGIKPGEWVVTEGVYTLVGGETVRLLGQDSQESTS